MSNRPMGPRIHLEPARIWLGLTVPGKKMSRILEPDGARLLNLYQGEPTMALYAVAIALHLAPDHAAQFGPAWRSTLKAITPGVLHGALLTDIRDFLKLRFKAKGLAEILPIPVHVLVTSIRTNNTQAVLETEEPQLVIGYAVSHLVSDLDVLSRNAEAFQEVNRPATTRRLCVLGDLALEAAHWLELRRPLGHFMSHHYHELDARFHGPETED